MRNESEKREKRGRGVKSEEISGKREILRRPPVAEEKKRKKISRDKDRGSGHHPRRKERDNFAEGLAI